MSLETQLKFLLIYPNSDKRRLNLLKLHHFCAAYHLLPEIIGGQKFSRTNISIAK